MTSVAPAEPGVARALNDTVERILFPAGIQKNPVPPVAAAHGYMREILVIALVLTFLFFAFEGGDGCEDRLYSPGSRAFEKESNLVLG